MSIAAFRDIRPEPPGAGGLRVEDNLTGSPCSERVYYPPDARPAIACAIARCKTSPVTG